MSSGSSVLSTVVTGGLGATLGGVMTALVQAVSRRNEGKATAADLITKAAGSMVERIEAENKQLRKAILLLIEVIDDVDTTLHPEAVLKLRAARRAAERAII
jgi:hypothetical protein